MDKKGGPLDKKQNSQTNGLGSLTENESFNRHYNKELKVSEGKIIYFPLSPFLIMDL